MIGKKWKQLAHKLKIKGTTIEDIEYRHDKDGLQELAYQILSSWRQKLGNKATRKILADALCDSDCYEAAKIL